MYNLLSMKVKNKSTLIVKENFGINEQIKRLIARENHGIKTINTPFVPNCLSCLKSQNF